MKRAIYMIIILLLPLCIYSNEIKEYKAEMVKFFDTADRSKEAVGFSKFNDGIAGCGPRCFTISDEDIIYVCDSCNYRIVKYDINFNYLGETKNRIIKYADSIKLSDTKNIFLIIEDDTIINIDMSNKIIYKTYASQISRKIFTNNNFFPIDNYLFFYTPENKIRLIDEQGIILDSKQAKVILQQKILTQGNSNFKDVAGGTEVNKYINENDLLCINDRMLHPDFSVFEKYNQFKRNVTVNKNTKTDTKQSFDIDSLQLRSHLFIGYDKDNNSYWSALKKIDVPDSHKQEYENIIIVYDNSGSIIDINKNTISHDNVCVSSAGDLYFMVTGVQVNGVAFYKITRRW